MKNKYITLVSGREVDWYWHIHCIVSREGQIIERGGHFGFDNLENVKEYAKIYRKTEKRKQYLEQYYQKHKEQKQSYDNLYYQRHKERTCKRVKEYRKTHKKEIHERRKEYQKNYWRTEKGKEIGRKNASRRRKLGFTPLNKPFDNSVAHHIDKEHIVYIPEKIHVQLKHKLEDKESMEEINTIAQFYISTFPIKNT